MEGRSQGLLECKRGSMGVWAEMEVAMVERKEGGKDGGSKVGCGGDTVSLTSASKVQPQGAGCDFSL